ncbi:MAG: FAD-dependent oxidoreductase [Myxococcota bacterium]
MSARPSPARDGAGACGEPDRPRAGRTAEFDVAVIGAGPAGCAAALAAASLGARVLLVDRGPALGGNVGNAFVHTICGLYELADDGPARFASPGLASRVAVALVRAGAAGELERAGRVWVLPTDPRAFARALDRALAREPAIERALPAELVALELGAPGAAHRLSLGAPREVGLGAPGARASAGGEGRAARGAPSAARTVAAWIAIDASGDGDAAALAGAATEIEPPDALQNPSYVLALRGVAADAVRGFARMRLAAATEPPRGTARSRVAASRSSSAPACATARPSSP